MSSLVRNIYVCVCVCVCVHEFGYLLYVYAGVQHVTLSVRARRSPRIHLGMAVEFLLPW